MYKFVLDIVQCHLFFLASFNEPQIVARQCRVELDGHECSLREHRLYLPVRHAVHMRIRMHAGSRIPSERGYSVVACNLSRIVVEPSEVVRVHHQAYGILRPYPRDGRHNPEDFGQFPVRLDQLVYPLVDLLDFPVQFGHYVSSALGDHRLDRGLLLREPLLAPADLEAAFVPHHHLPVEEELPELCKGFAKWLVHNGSVVIPHGVLGYHGGVGTVGFQPPDPGRVLDALCILEPHVESLSIEIIAQRLAVVARVLAAKQPE